MTSRRRRRSTALVLLLLFVVMPVVEIAVIIQVGQVIGPWWTIALLVLDSIIGAWLIKREGRRAWDALRTRLETGSMPTRELADGGLIVLGGTLMLSPGFVTDLLGVLVILPITRPIFRRLLTAAAARQVARQTTIHSTTYTTYAAHPGAQRPGTPPNATRPGPGAGTVVQGEVVDED